MSMTSVSVTAGLLIVACLFAYSDNRSPADDGKLKVGQKALGNFNVFSADSIIFEKSGNESIEIKRDASQRWKVHNGPTEFPVDDAKLRSFLVQLMSMQVGDRVPGGENRPQAFDFSGGDNPAALGSPSRAGGRISFRDAKGNVTLFQILSGKARPFGSGMYARFAGKPEVYLIAENLAPVYDANYWRDKAIVNANNENIAAVDLLALKGAPRIERASATAPWKQKGTDAARSILTPQFMEKSLPRLTDSLRELQFVRVIPKSQDDAVEKYKISTVGFELYSGKYYTVTLYERPESAPDVSKQYYASLQVRLVPGYSFGKFASFGLASDVADFNSKGASWFYVLDEASAKRFLVQ